MRVTRIAKVQRIERLNNSRDGNPRFRFLLEDGTMLATEPDIADASAVVPDYWEGQSVRLEVKDSTIRRVELDDSTPTYGYDTHVDGIELWGGPDYRESYLETPEDPAMGETRRDYYVVGYTEPLEWHMGHYGPVMRAMTTPVDETDPESPRWLTQEADRALVEVVKGHLSEPLREGLDLEETGGDDPNFTLATTIPGDVNHERLIDRAWEFTAALTNLTDPGTFGVPYLFREVAERLGLDVNELLRSESDD